MAVAVSVQSLSKSYGQCRALRNVSLELPTGVCFGLVGPNRAGKTTFLKLLLAVAFPDEGSVSVLGGSPDDPSVRRRIGYLPERLHLPENNTALGFLRSVARLKGLRHTDRDLRAQLDRVGLPADLNTPIRGFSKGTKQRLGLAAALVGQPDLLVLDEPSDGVDPIGRVEIRNILAEERARGATVFINSHVLSDIEMTVDRVGILVGGELLREGSRSKLCGTQGCWRVAFAPGVDPSALRGCGFEETGDGTWLCRADSAAHLNEKLDRARASGAQLTELRQEQRSLETVFTEEVRRRSCE